MDRKELETFAHSIGWEDGLEDYKMSLSERVQFCKDHKLNDPITFSEYYLKGYKAGDKQRRNGGL